MGPKNVSPGSSVFRHVLPVQIRFSDVDFLGHVSNVQYQSYFDLGKSDYFARVLPEMDFTGLCVVGASVKIDYLRPVFLHSPVVVKTRVSKLGTKSMTLEHHLCDRDSDEIHATCSVVMVCFQVKEQRSIPLPAEWKCKIREFEGL